MQNVITTIQTNNAAYVGASVATALVTGYVGYKLSGLVNNRDAAIGAADENFGRVRLESNWRQETGRTLCDYMVALKSCSTARLEKLMVRLAQLICYAVSVGVSGAMFCKGYVAFAEAMKALDAAQDATLVVSLMFIVFIIKQCERRESIAERNVRLMAQVRAGYY